MLGFSFSAPAKVVRKRSWTGDISMFKFTSSLWKEYNKSGSEKRMHTLVRVVFLNERRPCWPSGLLLSGASPIYDEASIRGESGH